MIYIGPDKKVSRAEYIKGFKRVLDYGTAQERKDFHRKMSPPHEIEKDGVRYFSLDATIHGNYCRRKRAFALARDPMHSFVTELGHTMLRVSSVLA